MKDQKTVEIDAAFEQMLVSAARYACGKRTYIVSDTVEYIIRLLPKLTERTIGVLLRDFEDNFRMEGHCPSTKVFGDDCDRKYWVKLNDACKKELSSRY